MSMRGYLPRPQWCTCKYHILNIWSGFNGNTGGGLVDIRTMNQTILKYQPNVYFSKYKHLIPKESDMGSKVDFYKKFLDESWANPPASITEASEKYLSADFKNFDEAGNVLMDRQTYIGMGTLLFDSFKDFKFIYSDISEVDDGVIVTGHFEGTHTGDLDLSAMGLGTVKASGKKVVWKDTKNKFAIEGDKFVSITGLGGDAGFGWFLEPLGVKLPSA